MGKEPVLTQLRRKWNWLGHTVRTKDDSIAKQALQWTLQGHRNRGDQRTGEKEIWRKKWAEQVSDTAGGR